MIDLYVFDFGISAIKHCLWGRGCELVPSKRGGHASYKTKEIVAIDNYKQFQYSGGYWIPVVALNSGISVWHIQMYVHGNTPYIC